VAPAKQLNRVEKLKPISMILSGLGVTSLTAYFGLLEVGRPSAGETVLVSAAAGAVGSVAAQLAKIHGCRVVGLAGSDDKCRWLTGELGLDAAINYKSGDLGRAIRDACPRGIDVYFDNGWSHPRGGAVPDARRPASCAAGGLAIRHRQPRAGPAGHPGSL
jgi:NADPH-dependent curcumin reductase CurA